MCKASLHRYKIQKTVAAQQLFCNGLIVTHRYDRYKSTKGGIHISNIIIPDEVFNGLDWQDFELSELLGCKIVGIEPIVDGLTDNANTVGICFTVESPDGSQFAVEAIART